jgi:ParB-like chromosome segregation protein Spo0J
MASISPPIQAVHKNQFRLVRKWVSSLKPSPENNNLYRPDDPGIRDLAKSINKFGLREPLIVTLDNFIVSGHRRFAALNLIGQKQCYCCYRS